MIGISRICVVFLLPLATITNQPAIVNLKPVEICPRECLCTTDVRKLGLAVKVQCGDRNLRSVPNITFGKPVSLLNVSFNELNTLKDNTFFQYESVNYIYLQYCKLESISDKTFQRLENLLFVDLSNNLLTSFSPNLFNGNHQLHTVILRNNDLSTYQGNTALLNGPSSLSFLDLQSCQLSHLSSETFSLLPNLKKIDISNNNLDHLNFNTLSALQQLQHVNLENNRLKCGPDFKDLRSGMQSSRSLFHNITLKCWHKNNTFEIWIPETPSSLYRPVSTPSVIPPLQPDTNSNTTLQLSTTVSHKPDTNTSTTLISLVTPSNKSDVSRNTTANPTTTAENETYGMSLIVIIIIVCFILLALIPLVYKMYKCSQGNVQKENPESKPLAKIVRRR